jgi:hypothetical protein
LFVVPALNVLVEDCGGGGHWLSWLIIGPK